MVILKEKSTFSYLWILAGAPVRNLSTVELIQVDELTFSPQSKSQPAVTCQWLDLSAQVL